MECNKEFVEKFQKLLSQNEVLLSREFKKTQQTIPSGQYMDILNIVLVVLIASSTAHFILMIFQLLNYFNKKQQENSQPSEILKKLSTVKKWIVKTSTFTLNSIYFIIDMLKKCSPSEMSKLIIGWKNFLFNTNKNETIRTDEARYEEILDRIVERLAEIERKKN